MFVRFWTYLIIHVFSINLETMKYLPGSILVPYSMLYDTFDPFDVFFQKYMN